jgi:hypothetical protein
MKNKKITWREEVENAISEGKKRFLIEQYIDFGTYEYFVTLEEGATNALKFKKENGELFWIAKSDIFDTWYPPMIIKTIID